MPDDTHSLTHSQRENSLKALLSKLAAGGLTTRLFYTMKRDKVFVKVACSARSLRPKAVYPLHPPFASSNTLFIAPLTHT
jgi:hypothetical protein